MNVAQMGQLLVQTNVRPTPAINPIHTARIMNTPPTQNPKRKFMASGAYGPTVNLSRSLWR